ncbi:glycosyltransferase family 4 protein [Candidatus Shapirobacteria bacterium]|nr:glycosyltransferase family 4 protein [Candidatus Shapirobacteria bacterium]
MRIVFTTFFKETRGGGLGRVSFEIAQAFAQKGHETVLVCPGEKTQLRKIAPHLTYLEIKSLGEDDVAIPYLTVANLQYLFNFLNKFSPAVIHGHDFGPITMVVQFWAINHQVPFVYTSHVLPTKFSQFAISEYSQAFGRFLDSTLLKKYFYVFFKSCDGLVALNESAKKDIVKFGFKEKIFVIPNGRNLQAYQKRKPASLSAKEKQLTFIGYLSKRKNQKYLLRVMECLPPHYVLNLIGSPINPKYLQELKAYAQKKKLKNVNFQGETPHEKIPEFLEKTHVLVSAATMEVQSLVIIEALASGTPVVGLSNETVDELVDEQVGVRLEKKTSPRLFAQKVKKICSLSSKDYETLCRECQKRVAHLNWPEIVRQTELAYQKLIRQKKITKQERKLKNIKEILELLPKSKFKEFLQKQIEKPYPKMEKKRNVFFFISTLGGTFLLGIAFWFLRKLKMIKNRR